MKEQNETEKSTKEFSEDCHKLLSSVSDALYAIGGKWKLMIIIAMARGNNRFTELQRMVNGISARVLSSELKELEMNGFIVKKVSVGLSCYHRVSITTLQRNAARGRWCIITMGRTTSGEDKKRYVKRRFFQALKEMSFRMAVKRY